MQKKIINIGMVGYGTVGRGVGKIIQEKNDILSEKAGVKLRLKRICDKSFKSTAVGIYTKKVEDIFNDPEIDIFVELIGGYEPAKRFISLALEKGMHVVTANKDVLARDFAEILAHAMKNKRRVYFEASVGAGIPIIAAINEGLCANEVSGITAILNGTTNFILTEMLQKKETFKKALQKAQRRGFAESDPTRDIAGFDSASKLAILSSMVFGTHVHPEDIYTRGIENVEQIDLSCAAEFGYAMKLFAVMKILPVRGALKGVFPGNIQLQVAPAFIKAGHPLASVNGEYNAIYVNTDAAGDMMFYGRGAGALPAASAVVSDIVYTARHILERSARHIPFLRLKKTKLNIADVNDIESSFYIRFTAVDEPGVLARISTFLADYRISIDSVIQKEGSIPSAVPIIMLTHRAKMGNIIKALTAIDSLKIIRKKTVFYGILEL